MGNLKRIKGSSPVFRLKDSQNIEKPIRLDYSYGRGKRFRYGIGYSVNPDYWNKQTGRVKNVNAVRNAGQINKLIRDLTTVLEDFVADCDSKQIPITNRIMKTHLDEFRNKDFKQGDEEETKITGLIVFIEKYIKQKEKELSKQRNGYKNNTVKSYEQTLGHLKGFEEEYECVLSFDLDNEFYSEFIDYMNFKTYTYNKEEKHYSLNTIGKQVKNLRIFMGAALEQELHTNLKYKKFKVLVEITTAIYLELEELKKIYELDLSSTPHLELARDVFIIGCEIGQRISDYHNLSEQPLVEHQNERFIKIKQEKTDKEVLCKITPVIENIMNERYGGKLPPKIAEQKLNDYIKIVGEKAGIISQIKNEITRSGNKVIEYIPKCDLIMGHTARRTFCTLKYKAGMPVHSIMELSGHSTLKEFMKYIRNPKEERVSQITSTKAFMDSCIIV
ncbi:site-specific integrase [Maribacter aestuarii]|uniref:site-specific integrase n=1 Tax=Maribacter aestuarii TaxID=1130723 RepID=UPI00248B0F65|nr:site-specific integrase [Maribacter aestuarii]